MDTSRLAALLLLLAFGACKTVSPKDVELAQVHEKLAQESLQAGDPRAALAEIEKAVQKDPKNPEARNFYGLLLHLYFDKPERAIGEYRQAIELKPDYSEAKVNLAAVLTAVGRCSEALPLLEQARADLLYRAPYLAENNLGWCKYQLGDTEGALLHLRAAVSGNPSFCLGFRNLGEIYEKQGKLEQAHEALEKYAKACPEQADADYRRGVLFLRTGSPTEARMAFRSCKDKARDGELAKECDRQVELIGEP